jgi:hypothetical protein
MASRLVNRWWDRAQERITRFQDSRRIDRQWDEIWFDAPRGTEEQALLIEAAEKLEESVALVEKAWKLAQKRGGPEF